MSTHGVRTRFVHLLARSGGKVSETDYRALLDHARERGFTSGELKALLQPANYLENSTILRGRGVGLDEIRFAPGAWALAESLAAEFHLPAPCARMPNARPRGSTPAPAPAPPPAHRDTLPAALARGHSLGDPSTWKVETSGAVVAFTSAVGDERHPGVVYDMPAWQDPAPRDLLAERHAAVTAVRDLAGVSALVHKLTAAHADYLAAEGVAVRGANHRYGIQDLRRHALFERLAAALADAHLSAGERAGLPGLLLAEKEALLCGRDYEMETGTHTNYWPYWDNYRGSLAKMLAQSAPGSDDYHAIKNRLEDILDHKTVFGFGRAVDEQDVEATLGAALVYRLPWFDGPGQRVSLAAGSFPTAPIYEVLEVPERGLPPALARHAGRTVVRDTDAAGTLRFDGPGELAGVALPAKLVPRVRGRRVAATDLGVRELGPGEKPRARFPGDWRGDGSIGVTPIEIGWWGHCHNESPLNAMGIDPEAGVELYRAERGVPAAAALQSYSAEDIWDVAGALAADHEGGFGARGPMGLRPNQVEVTKFVGSRNDGGHWILLALAQVGARRVRIDAEVIELWHKSDPQVRYPRPEERFRRDLPAPDGTFAANPDSVAAEVDDEDEIDVDVLGRRLRATTTFVTFDAAGRRHEIHDSIALDPAVDRAVKLADEILSAPAGGGGVLAEHWYNPKRAEYHQILVDVDGRGRRAERERGRPVAVKAAVARQETAYDSVVDLHDFITKNMGLPFTCDTSSGLAVWNYPVKTLRIDRTRQVDRREGDEEFTYASYKLRYTTMGGPSGQAGYIIKRDRQGNAVRAVALDPMPDFAFRNEHWVCAPVAADVDGKPAYNLAALEAGYLTDRKRERLVTGLWRRQAALLYASLTGPRGKSVFLFETEAGDLVAFPERAAFEAAVAADRALR